MNSTERDSVLKDRIRGCFLGLAVGDALGMPVETMSHAKIMAATGGLGVRDYLPPIQTRVRDTVGLPSGSTTDDTQLTLAVARSIVSRGGFDLIDQAHAHVEALESSAFGWGGTTQKAIESIREWFRAQSRSPQDGEPGSGRDPEIPAPQPNAAGSGGGNGVAMKIAPLAVWHFSRFGLHEMEPFLSETMDLGLMTHGDPRASFAAIALGAAIGACLETDRQHPTFSAGSLDFAMQHVIDLYVVTAEQRYRYFRPNADTLSARLSRAWHFKDDADTLRRQVKNSSFAMESVPFAIATFLRHPLDFEKAVLEAVNAGGDADTTASMVGALCGTLLGESAIPPRFTSGLRDAERIRQYADVFVRAIEAGHLGSPFPLKSLPR